jgi:hypothetical protein
MDYMIDIETLGKKPGSIIASIGVVEFDPIGGALGRRNKWVCDLEKQHLRGFVMEIDTVKWWMKQSDQARANTFGSPCPWDLSVALSELDYFLAEGYRSGITSGIWANSPSFDLAHLDHAYDVYDMDSPWTYRQPRDCRTIFDATGFDYGMFCSTFDLVAHDALDDAKMQAMGVIEAYKRIAR